MQGKYLTTDGEVNVIEFDPDAKKAKIETPDGLGRWVPESQYSSWEPAPTENTPVTVSTAPPHEEVEITELQPVELELPEEEIAEPVAKKPPRKRTPVKKKPEPVKKKK